MPDATSNVSIRHNVRHGSLYPQNLVSYSSPESRTDAGTSYSAPRACGDDYCDLSHFGSTGLPRRPCVQVRQRYDALCTRIRRRWCSAVAVGSLGAQGLPGRTHSLGRGLDRHRRRHGRPRLHRPLRRPGDEGVLLPGAVLFAVWPLIATGLVCLASGGVLGLGTKWGLIRYW